MATLPDWIKEAWIEYGIGILVFILRIFTRIAKRGWRWQADDFLTILALLCYTIWVYALHIISQNGLNFSEGLNKIAEGIPGMSEKIIYGSKHNVAAWYSYVGLLWSLKTCMLLFYSRLTVGLWKSRKIIIGTAILLGVTFIVNIIVLSTHCYPFKLNWQVKPFPGTCPLDVAEFYGVGITNMITDSVLLCIPIPMLWKAHISTQRKLFLFVLLCGGAFIIVATFLRTLFSILYAVEFIAEPKPNVNISGSILAWAMRECTVAVIVVNAPIIVPMFRPSTWRNGFRSGYSGSNQISSSQQQPKGSIALDRIAQGNNTITNEHDDNNIKHSTTIRTKPSDLEQQEHYADELHLRNNSGDTKAWSSYSKDETLPIEGEGRELSASQEYIMPLRTPTATYRPEFPPSRTT